MLIQRSTKYASVVHIRLPGPPRFIFALGHVIAKLDVLAAVEAEPALLERVLDRVRVRRDVAEEVLQAAFGMFFEGRRGGGEGACEEIGEGCEEPRGAEGVKGGHRCGVQLE